MTAFPGTPNNDVIFGGQASDFIDGQNGDDIIRGGNGQNEMILQFGQKHKQFKRNYFLSYFYFCCSFHFCSYSSGVR